jgi:hypothetical protein
MLDTNYLPPTPNKENEGLYQGRKSATEPLATFSIQVFPDAAAGDTTRKYQNVFS